MAPLLPYRINSTSQAAEPRISLTFGTASPAQPQGSTASNIVPRRINVFPQPSQQQMARSIAAQSGFTPSFSSQANSQPVHRTFSIASNSVSFPPLSSAESETQTPPLHPETLEQQAQPSTSAYFTQSSAPGNSRRVARRTTRGSSSSDRPSAQSVTQAFLQLRQYFSQPNQQSHGHHSQPQQSQQPHYLPSEDSDSDDCEETQFQQMSSHAPPPQSHFRYKVVCELSCRSCQRLLCIRGMKAILLADTKVELFSTDTPPLGVALVNDDYMTENCHCRIHDVACLGCGNVVGYHVTQPCDSCLDSCNNGHFWMFQIEGVTSEDRVSKNDEMQDSLADSDQNFGSEKPLLWAFLPPASADWEWSERFHEVSR